MTNPTSSSPDAQPSHDEPPFRYTPHLAADIEQRWQQYWEEKGVFHSPNPVGELSDPSQQLSDNRVFVQDMFPYPSGVGLHVGHPLGYIATDVFARYQRMKGNNVLHTLGYDAFGLPAEQYAIQTGTHPRTTTEANIKNMQRQLNRLGLGHDKRRSVATTDREFFHWTQWIFLQIYNSWFDPDADNGKGKARPIAELEKKLAEEREDWQSLDAAQRQEIIDEYRLVYRSYALVNWCPGLGTVLANEEVTADGRSERGNFPVFRKKLSQWMMRITAYSDRLLEDLEVLDWSDKVKAIQRNWIGRSQGAEVSFPVVSEASIEPIRVFTTRPDTLFGATYIAIAPEHELCDVLLEGRTTQDYEGIDPRWTYGQEDPRAAVAAYRTDIAAKTDIERQENKEKTGVFTGVYATNPVNGAEIPIFVADYVLSGYGTGAVMAVPAHDERDQEFAEELGLPSRSVITEDGVMINSSNGDDLDLAGLSIDEAKDRVISWLEDHSFGDRRVQYKLRDWLFARQRYWGEPFPIVYDEQGVAHSLPESLLPVELPEIEDYNPVTFDPEDADSEPQPPLAKVKDWVEVELDLGDGRGVQTYYRDTNVMPQWAGSSWYQLRYIDPHNSESLVDIENERYWTGPREGRPSGGVDLYVGGMEHAVLHLLYARFWHKVLFDLGHVSSYEPYYKLFNQGYIQAYAYTDPRGVYVPAEEVEEREGSFYWDGPNGEVEVTQEYGKMGKSLKNAVSPDEICDKFGADTLRVYEMSMGPLDASRPWATKDVVGSQRFLQRVWRLVVDEHSGEVILGDSATQSLTDEDQKILHRTIAGVTEDYQELHDNTAVAKLIEYVNYITKTYPKGAPQALVEPLVQMLSPVAPHIAEELWHRLGHEGSITYIPFPEAEEKWLVDENIEIPVQVMGKVRSRITVPADAKPAEVEATALADPHIQKHCEGKQVRKVIVVPGRMVNVVLG